MSNAIRTIPIEQATPAPPDVTMELLEYLQRGVGGALALDFHDGESNRWPLLPAVTWNRFDLTWQNFKDMTAEVDTRHHEANILILTD